MESEPTCDSWEPTRVPVYAVVRFDRSEADGTPRVMVRAVLAGIEEAEAEVAELNAAVPPGHDIVYILSATDFFPGGRARPVETRTGMPGGPPAAVERMESEWGFLVDALDGVGNRTVV